MLKSLNSESLKIVSSLYDGSPGFRQGLDRLLHEEAKSAVELTNRLQKFMSTSGSDSPEVAKPTKKTVKKTGTGKRGRPKGSTNKPKEPKTEPVVQGEAVDAAEAKLTHGSAILEALNASPTGLTAAEILESISNAKHEGYTVPSKATLQTTLVGLHNKKVIKSKGQRPNTTYFAK